MILLLNPKVSSSSGFPTYLPIFKGLLIAFNVGGGTLETLIKIFIRNKTFWYKEIIYITYDGAPFFL